MTSLQQKLPVTYLLVTRHGRLGRLGFTHAMLLIGCAFYLFYVMFDRLVGHGATWPLYPMLFWSVIAVSSKRLHDLGSSGKWLLVAAVPVLGPLYLVWLLLLRRGQASQNAYGPGWKDPVDYHKNDLGCPEPSNGRWIINDVTKLNPVVVQRVVRPGTVQELQDVLRASSGAVSVGGGRFSMGGQTASPGSLHVDLRGLNSVTEFSKAEKWIRVQAGIRWCDIQHFIDPHDLSVKIMQSYANFTVGGALSVNAHGRYVGLGPVVLSVRWIDLVLADGTLVRASRSENTGLFFAAIGGYASLGIIAEVELDLTDNTPVECVHHQLSRRDYPAWFGRAVRDDSDAVFHNGDMYPPSLERVRAVTWRCTNREPSTKTRLMPLRESYPINRYFIWAFSETPFGRWRREHLIEPLIYLRPKVRWRNYEAGYDVAEIEPRSRTESTYVLQEYFVPVANFEAFAAQMAEIFIRHGVNVLNVSIRHSVADPGTMLAWARQEVFAFVIYHKQRTDTASRRAVAVWTRELIEAALQHGGTYYLPYQPHATMEQFHRSYPGASQLFALKQRLDPGSRFRNTLLDKYYQPAISSTMTTSQSEFHAVFDDTTLRDAFYRFLQVVFHLYPEDRFHHLINEVCARHEKDGDIYGEVQRRLKDIKPFLSELTYALPALRKQKREMSRQTLELLGDTREINGYVEIGSTGRYISDLRHQIKVGGQIFLVNDVAPGNSVGDIFERGQISRLGQFIDLNNYMPLDPAVIAGSSVDLVTIYIGFHHCPTERLDAFVGSIHRVLRPGGSLIVRDHDVRTPTMATFVSLVHTVFNLGLGVSCQTNDSEFKGFRSMDEWVRLLSQHGFSDTGKRLFQHMDPSDNALVRLVKR